MPRPLRIQFILGGQVFALGVSGYKRCLVADESACLREVRL